MFIIGECKTLQLLKYDKVIFKTNSQACNTMIAYIAENKTESVIFNLFGRVFFIQKPTTILTTTNDKNTTIIIIQ